MNAPIEPGAKPKEGGGSSWLLTYSDLVTLLLAFFVLLVSISVIDPVKVQLITQYFTEAEVMSYDELLEIINTFIIEAEVEDAVDVGVTQQGVEITFKDRLLFDLGRAELKPQAHMILSEIANLLQYKQLDKRKILVEGHTDHLPISSAVFPSNWELASARAGSVVRFFIDRGVNPQRFKLIGYADTRPKITDISPGQGEPENRRVAVVISPKAYYAETSREEMDLLQDKE